MRYFIDCEFIEDGKIIDLISIGIVAEDGRELYLQSSEFDSAKASQWVKENVLPHLWNAYSSRESIKQSMLWFMNPQEYGKPELWGYYSAYDHVAFCQLFGTMMDLPASFPMYTRDLKQWADQLGAPIPQQSAEGEHNALVDARYNQIIYRFLDGYEKAQVNQ